MIVPIPERRFAAFTKVPLLVVWLLSEVVLYGIGIPHDPSSLWRPHFVIADNGMIETDSFLDNLEGGACYQKVALTKKPGVYRVAILGGASVEQLGDADVLQRRLIEANIAPKVEVLNFGLCGCGTDRAVMAARQALRLDVDAIALYAGHNEFISESNFQTYRQPGWFRHHSRVFQLCTGNPWQPEPGRIYSPVEKEVVYTQFRNNLRQLDAMTRVAGVRLIWCSVAMNLRKPLVAYELSVFDQTQLSKQPMQDFLEGMELLEQGRYDNAKTQLERAIASGPRPMRATTRINSILRNTAAELAVPLADVEDEINRLATNGIPGADLFHDHCHLHAWFNSVVLESIADVLIREVSSETVPSHSGPGSFYGYPDLTAAR